MNRQFHVQTILNLLLFLIFVIGSFFIVSSEIQGYQNIHESINCEDDLMIPLAYMNTKIKAYDQRDMITLVELEDITCLKMSDESSSTYIYYRDGYIQEVSVADYYIPLLDEGEKLFAVDDMKITLEQQLCYIRIENDHQYRELSVYLHS